MTTQEMIAGLRDADRSMTPGRWEDYHTDDSSFMSMSTVGIGAEPADENDLGRTVLVTLLQMPGVVNRENSNWEEDAIFCAWLRNNASAIADEMERLANEASHIKGMLLAATHENERLRAENERLNKALAAERKAAAEESRAAAIEARWGERNEANNEPYGTY